MEIDLNDLVWIEVTSGEELVASGSTPVVVGIMSDNRPSYLFNWKDKDNRWYDGFGPSREEAMFLVSDPDGQLMFRSPDPGDRVCLYALRYDEDQYVQCEHYVDRMRSVSGVDWTGPFCWEFVEWMNDSDPPDVEEADGVGDGESSKVEEVSGESDGEEDGDMDSVHSSEEWYTAEDCSIVSVDDWNTTYGLLLA